MNTYFGIFIVATFAAVVLTPLVRRWCERLNWVDAVGEARRVHRVPVPRLGGVAVFAATLLALAALWPVRNLVTEAVHENLWQLTGTLAPAALVFLFGLYDDLRGAGARAKFLMLGAAAALFYAMGGRVELLSVPMVGTVELAGPLSLVVTVVWVVGVANAFNLIDGVDGLATGAALFASLVMLVVALVLGHPLVAVVACALCGALTGFLRYNFNPASIFLGDSGALTVGFILAALSVHGAQKASTAVAVAIPLLAFGVPVIDTAFTLVRRFVSGRPLFVGDREHIHHMLLARGWSQRRVAFVLYGACALFGMAALALGVGRLRYHEVDELKASVRRSFGDRRLRAANNIAVRRAVRRMSEAADLEGFFAALTDLLELGEFASARVRLGHAALDAARAEGLLQRVRAGTLSLRTLRVEGRSFCWSWARGDAEASEAESAGRCWTMRLPLTTDTGEWGFVNLYREIEADALLLDVNYLCHLFRRETARAAERILSAPAAPAAAHATPAAKVALEAGA